MNRRAVILFLSLCLMCARPAAAGELFGFFGGTKDTSTKDGSYAWSMEYRESLGEHFAASLVYLNEGHLPNHHRDGHGAMLWARTNLLDRRLSLAVGAGPYYYFDTTEPPTGGYHNEHGFAAIVGLSATWYTKDSPWLVQLRLNSVTTKLSIDTATPMIGIGYQLDRPATPGPLVDVPSQAGKTTGNELTVLVGRTIVNSFSSEKAYAASVEYRRGLMRYLDGTIAWMYEEDNDMIRRHGLVMQLWLTRAFFDESLTLAYGMGPYLALDEYRTDVSSRFAELMLSMSASYRFSSRWAARVTWNRVATEYDNDTDIIMLGLGYRF